MALIHKNIFDWQEDLDNFDFKEAVRKSSVTGTHVNRSKLSLKGKIRKLLCRRKNHAKQTKGQSYGMGKRKRQITKR